MKEKYKIGVDYAAKEKKISLPALIGIIVGGILLLGVIFIIAFEDTFIGKLYITNDTDLDITNITVTFEDDEEELYYEVYSGSVEKNSKLVEKIQKKYDFTGTEQYCCAYVTFENGEEIYLYDGYFDSIFKGNIRFDFTKEDGKYLLKAKAGTGMTEDTSSTEMDTDFILYPEIGDWDYYNAETGEVIDFDDFDWEEFDDEEFDDEEFDDEEFDWEEFDDEELDWEEFDDEELDTDAD